MRQPGNDTLQPERPGRKARTAHELIDELLCPVDAFTITMPSRSINGDRRLMLAVLEDALAAYARKGNLGAAKKQVAYEEAEQWISSNETHWPYSFLNVCAALNIDPDYLREGLSKAKRRIATSFAEEIFSSLAKHHEEITREDIERAVVKAFGCNGLGHDSHADRAARVAYFRALMSVLGYTEGQILSERVRLGWKYSAVFLKHLYATHIHSKYCVAIKDELLAIMKERATLAEAKKTAAT